MKIKGDHRINICKALSKVTGIAYTLGLPIWWEKKPGTAGFSEPLATMSKEKSQAKKKQKPEDTDFQGYICHPGSSLFLALCLCKPKNCLLPEPVSAATLSLATKTVLMNMLLISPYFLANYPSFVSGHPIERH